MSDDYVCLARGPLLSIFTCPLCNDLLKEAVIICNCNHAFCKDCIYQHFVQDISSFCPVCKAYLGPFPEQCVRPDHNLRKVITHIFPLGNITTTTQRSEALLAVDKTNQRSTRNDEANVITQNVCASQGTPRRTHNIGIAQDLNEFPTEIACDSAFTVKKAQIVCNSTTRRSTRNDEVNVITQDARTSQKTPGRTHDAGIAQDLNEFPNIVSENTTQKSTRNDEANVIAQNVVVSRDTQIVIRDAVGRAAKEQNYICPTSHKISCSSAVTHKKKKLRQSILPQVVFTKSDIIMPEDFATEACENPHQERDACHVGNENWNNVTCKTLSIISDPGPKDQTIQKKRSTRTRSSDSWSGRRSNSSMLGVSNLMGNQSSDSDRMSLDSGKSYGKAASVEGSYDEMKIPSSVWFCLLACEDKTGNALPQIPKPYIRTNVGDQPIAHICKYLAQNLNLKHESEVEIMCFDEPLMPNMPLKDLINMWAQAKFGNDMEPVYLNSGAGSPDARNFVMELTYRRNKAKGIAIGLNAEKKMKYSNK